MSDRTPFEYSATVPSGYKVVENVYDKFKVYYVKNYLHDLGIVTEKTSFGNLIKVYKVERTICDIIRSRSRVDIQLTNDALKRFVQLKSIDYTLLMEYAKELKIESVLKNYLELLL